MSEMGAAGPPGAFVVAGDRWQFRGVLAFDDAMSVVEAAQSLPLPNSGTIDLAGLEHADSSALAVMLATFALVRATPPDRARPPRCRTPRSGT